jgi:hypothetical protein
MPPRKRIDAENRTRIPVVCSKQQKLMLEAAAVRSGCDLSTLILTYTLRGIGALGVTEVVGEASDAPVIVNGTIGARLRARAIEQGVQPDRMLELLLVSEG